MQELYVLTTKLLGRSEADSAFAELCTLTGCSPRLLRNKEHHREHSFGECGFSLGADSKGFKSLFIHIATEATRAGSIKPFAGKLPFGIEQDDCRGDVQRKVGKEPLHSQLVPGKSSDSPKDAWDDYESDSFVVRFMFCGPDGGIGAVSVRLKSEH